MYKILKTVFILFLTLTTHISPFLGNLTLRAQSKDSIILAGGCFWCVEADFEKVNGVSEVISGYTGGFVENPTYKQVVKGGTGHYEAVIIHFDPKIITTKNILDKFFRSIDPTDAGPPGPRSRHLYNVRPRGCVKPAAPDEDLERDLRDLGYD